MSIYNNLNKGFYKNLDENFNMACELAEKDFSHDELLNMLKNGNIPEKQISALKFDAVNSKEDAEALINNLTGCDGKIREAVALKIFQLLSENYSISKHFAQYAEIFANASIDINGNICRLIVDSTVFLKQNHDFASNYTNIIVKFAHNALDELDRFIFKDKKYVINKQLFKLYWCLEALKNFYEFKDIDVIKNILEKSAKISEYTIREKTAEIAVLSENFSDIKQKLEADENYYVRKACKKK